MTKDGNFYRKLMVFSDAAASEAVATFKRMLWLYEHDKERKTIVEERLMLSDTIKEPCGPMSAVDVNPGRVFNEVETNIAHLTYADPKIAIEGAPTAYQETLAPLHATLVNQVMATSEAFAHARTMAVRDGSLCGNGVVMTVCPLRPNDEAPRKRRAPKGPVDPVAQYLEGQVKAEAVEAILAQPAGELERDFRGHYYGLLDFIHVPPTDLIVDPKAASAEDYRFIGRKFLVDEDLLKKQFPGFDGTPVNDGDPIPQVSVCEVYVRNEDQNYDLVYFAENGEAWFELQEHDEDSLWIDHPYRVLRMHNSEGFWGSPELLASYGAIKAERLFWSRTLLDVGGAPPDVLLLGPTASLSEEQKHSIPEMPGIKILQLDGQLGDNAPLNQQVMHIPKSARAFDGLNVLPALERAFQLASGYGPNQQGQVMKSETSASEALALQSYARTRAVPKTRRMDWFMSGWSFDILGTAAQYWGEETIGRILGAVNAKIWAQHRLSRADVQRNLHVKVFPGSMQPVSEETRAQGAIQALGLINQDPDLRAMVSKKPLIETVFASLGYAKDSAVWAVPAIQQAPQPAPPGEGAPPPQGGGTPNQNVLGALLGG